MTKLIGVEYTLLEKLGQDVQMAKTEMSDSLESIKRIMDGITDDSSYMYKCESGTLLRQKYVLCRDQNFQTILNNLETYSQDLGVVYSFFSQAEQDLSNNINESKQEIQNIEKSTDQTTTEEVVKNVNVKL